MCGCGIELAWAVAKESSSQSHCTALHNVQWAVAKESPPPHSATEQHQGRAVGDMDDDGDHDDYDDDDKDALHSSLGT